MLTIIFTGINPMTEASLIQDTKSDELPPFMISLGDMPARIPLAVLERKLSGLRTLYAVFYLLQTHRTNELFAFLKAVPDGDIEKSLLAEDESLHVESISHGSWVLVAWAKTQASFKAVASVVGLAYERGREAYLSKLEANARLSHANARRAEIAAAKDDFNLKKSQFDYLLKVSSKAPTPELRKHLESIALAAVRDLTASDTADSSNNKLLQGPSSK